MGGELVVETETGGDRRGVRLSALILVSQALAAIESNIVLAEATPLRTVLRASAARRATRAQAVDWLRGLVNAYAQRRFPAEARLIVKFMAADVLDNALIRDAFPDTPWIFVTRDPAEILASQRQMGGIDLMRGQISAGRLGLDEAAMWRMDDGAFKAHALAAFAKAGLAAHACGRGLILDYAELPEALWTKLGAHFGLDLDLAAVERMQAVSRRHSKRPAETFSPERDPSRIGAAQFQAIVEPITGEIMAALAALRTA
jgi:hypothetical protein